jgi:hypothetical protein
MGDVTEGGLTVDQRTKALTIRRRELEIQNLLYQTEIARFRADELAVEIIRQHEQAKANEEKILVIKKEVAGMKGETIDG